MGMLEELIKMNDGQPKAVTAGLVGVIAAGIVGGGLWVNSLKSRIESQEKNATQQLTIVSEKYVAENAELNRRSALLAQQVDVFSARLATVDTALNRTTRLLETMREAENSRRYTASIDSVVLDLKLASRELQIGLQDSRLLRMAESRGFTGPP